jgi:hypothetical protein
LQKRTKKRLLIWAFAVAAQTPVAWIGKSFCFALAFLAGFSSEKEVLFPLLSLA